eukprot:4504853-Amphidinium_carterae.1
MPLRVADCLGRSPSRSPRVRPSSQQLVAAYLGFQELHEALSARWDAARSCHGKHAMKQRESAC